MKYIERSRAGDLSACSAKHRQRSAKKYIPRLTRPDVAQSIAKEVPSVTSRDFRPEYSLVNHRYQRLSGFGDLSEGQGFCLLEGSKVLGVLGLAGGFLLPQPVGKSKSFIL